MIKHLFITITNIKLHLTIKIAEYFWFVLIVHEISYDIWYIIYIYIHIILIVIYHADDEVLMINDQGGEGPLWPGTARWYCLLGFDMCSRVFCNGIYYMILYDFNGVLRDLVGFDGIWSPSPVVEFFFHQWMVSVSKIPGLVVSWNQITWNSGYYWWILWLIVITVILVNTG